MLFEEVINAFRPFGALDSDNAEYVVFRAGSVQEMRCIHDPIESIFACQVLSAAVVYISRSVQRQADQETIRRQKLRPLLINKISVRLDSVEYPDIFFCVFALQLQDSPVKPEPCESGFAALKQESTVSVGVVQG